MLYDVTTSVPCIEKAAKPHMMSDHALSAPFIFPFVSPQGSLKPVLQRFIKTPLVTWASKART